MSTSHERLAYDAAVRDDLTRLYCRRFFQDRLASEFAYAKRHKTLLSLVKIDIDDFKKVNDVHGGHAGDAALAQLARLIHTAIRTEDVAARYGDDEFAIICRGIRLVNAGVLGERIRAVTEQANFDFEGQRMPIRISVGISALPECEVNGWSELVDEADEALIEAKRTGRNRVCLNGV